MAKYRKLIQLITFIVFFFLIFKGRPQVWMILFVGGLLISVFRGRLYCGYLCPINTVMEVIDSNAETKKRKRLKTPEWVKSKLVRRIMLVIFLGTMILVFKTGKKLPVLPVLFLSGVSLTLFFEPNLWHRYICPYGTLFSIFSRKNTRGLTVEDTGCIKCGICVRGCPTDAIQWEDKKLDPIIYKSECIVCGKCENKCPQNVINYQR